MTRDDLHSQLDHYLELKTGLGQERRRLERSLLAFIDYLHIHGEGVGISNQLVLDWVCSTQCGPAGQRLRLGRARGFLHFLRASLPGTQVPPFNLIAGPTRPTPYIYSREEIAALINAAGQLSPRGALRPHTHATFIGLLAGSGLRMGEAIRLRDTDVSLDQDPAVITVRESKFKKSRLVPLHPSVGEKLNAYRKRRGRSESFFIDDRGKALHPSLVREAFVTTRKRANITSTNDGRHPTLHALRHTFAVNRLVSWYQEGRDINRWLPHLSVYLGHAKPEYTYWYLTATPELLRQAADVFERYAGGGRP
jgi:integrase/recombinase XerD